MAKRRYRPKWQFGLTRLSEAVPRPGFGYRQRTILPNWRKRQGKSRLGAWRKAGKSQALFAILGTITEVHPNLIIPKNQKERFEMASKDSTLTVLSSCTESE
jgi:hypothetical protein